MDIDEPTWFGTIHECVVEGLQRYVRWYIIEAGVQRFFGIVTYLFIIVYPLRLDQT